MSQEWYYSANGDRQGPITGADLKKLAEAGKLKSADLVWKDGMADWVEAKSIKGLFGGTGTAPAASKTGEQAAAKARPVADDTDARPARSRRRDEDDEEDDRPVRSRRRDEDDDEDRPAKSRRRDEDDDEDRPARRRDEDDEDDDDDRPRKKKRRIPEDIGSKKMTAGLLGILIGWSGAHRFYLGDTSGGIIRLCLTLLVCSSHVIGMIEGIIYLTKSDEDFYQDYIVDQKGWF